MNTIGPNLPKFKKLFIKLIVWLQKAISKCCNCEGRFSTLTEKDYECDIGNTIPIIIIMTTCLGIGIFCFVVAVFPQIFPLGVSVFCFIWEIVVQWITVIFSNVSTNAPKPTPQPAPH